MSEAPDKESKTEEATPRKLEDAIEKGNTPVSREAASLAGLVGIALVVQLLPVLYQSKTAPLLGMLLDKPAEVRLGTAEDAITLLGVVGSELAPIVLVPMLVFMALGLGAAFLQNPPGLKYDRVKPSFDRVSPRSGLQRIFGVTGVVEFAKAVFKFGLLIGLIVYYFNSQKNEFINALQLDPIEIPIALGAAASRLCFAVVLFMAALVIADLVWSRLKWRHDLRMTKQEIKDEQKQAEGDPLVKAKQRSLARERARRRMMAAVPRATVVIANPTHYAVALRYVQGEQAAPLVLAKGLDLVALRIRSIAEENGIPVVEDRALARSLYEAVVPERPIPPQFYKAVAEIVLFLMQRSGARKQNTPGAAPPAISGPTLVRG
jgi:flagellar biosynthetic protein FlhB